MVEEKKKMRTSPRGIACFPFLNSPKEDLQGKEKYSVQLRIDPNEGDNKAFLDGLSEEMKAVYPKGHLPFKRELEKDTEKETGMVLVSFNCLAEYPPKLFDRFNKKIEMSEVNIGYGSEIKVAFIANLYEIKKLKKSGMNLYLQGVQIIDLVEHQGRTAEDLGFTPIEEPKENEGGDTEIIDENGNPPTHSADSSSEEVPF